MYGTMDLGVILPEVTKIGAEFIDVWPRVHGNQREQIEKMGHAAFAAMLDRYGAKLGVLTHYDLGPFALQDEMLVARKFGAELLICGGQGPKDLVGSELKAAVKQFAEQMKPHIAAAEEAGVTIGIENHGNNLIDSPDSVKWLAEFVTSPNLGIALAPYHLEQDPAVIANLVRDLGDRMVMFYAWQHGKGSGKLPKEDELLQMPGRGPLDFGPIVKALRETHYKGFVSIFMHPYPRGVAIQPTAGDVTSEINRARRYLESLPTS
ncbi:MAG: sugar phosphate isomerase/epimerase [Acidobacteria bacterium]|nr:sugar phosphate isomerase/epimerase [Acidobacteriota bacterium]